MTSAGEDEAAPFTAANVFSLFAALAFSILSQPSGGILFKRPNSRLGWFLFFIWRLNPVACLQEAVLIAIILLDGLREAAGSATLSRQRRNFSRKEGATIFFRSFGETIAAAKLLRMHGHIDASSGTSAGGADDDQRQDQEQQEPLSGRGFPTLPLPLVSRPEQPTSASGEAEGSTTTVGQNSLDEPSTSGRRSLATLHQLVATIAALSAALKLATSRLPFAVSFPAWFMTVGWAAVQAIVVSAPDCRAPTSTVVSASPRSTLRRYRRRALQLQKMLYSHAGLLDEAMVGLVGLLIIFIVGFDPWAAGNTTTSSVMKPLAFGVMAAEFLANTPLVGGTITIFLADLSAIDIEDVDRGGPDRLSNFAAKLRLARKGLWHSRVWIVSWTLPMMVLALLLPLRSLLWENGDFMWGAAGGCNLPLPALALTVYKHVVPDMPYEGSYRRSEWSACSHLFSGLFLTACGLVVLLAEYDDSGTSKPGWLEWLP